MQSRDVYKRQVIAYQWIASDKPLYEIAGFQLLARLFANGKEPNERGINEVAETENRIRDSIFYSHVVTLQCSLSLIHISVGIA